GEFRPGTARPRRELAWPPPRERIGLHHAPTIPANGEGRRAPGPLELAISGGAVPRVLRRLHPQPPAPGKSFGRSGNGPIARGGKGGFAYGPAGGGSDSEPLLDRAGRDGLAGAGFRIERSIVSK